MKITFKIHSTTKEWITYEIQVLVLGFVVKTKYFSVYNPQGNLGKDNKKV